MSVPGWIACIGSMSWSVGRICPAATTLWTSVTTTGMTVNGIATQVTSPIIPFFITWASIWPNPAWMATRPASAGTSMPAGRSIGLTTSPGRRMNCSTQPSTPAYTVVLVSATSACLSAASALAFSAGS